MKVTIEDVSSAISVSFITIAAGAAFGVWTGLGALVGILSMAVASIVAGLFGGFSVKTSGPTGTTAALLIGVLASLNGNKQAIFFVLLLFKGKRSTGT